jgi:hypothetical protein
MMCSGLSGDSSGAAVMIISVIGRSSFSWGQICGLELRARLHACLWEP